MSEQGGRGDAIPNVERRQIPKQDGVGQMRQREGAHGFSSASRGAC
jgi:hypothetical protein